MRDIDGWLSQYGMRVTGIRHAKRHDWVGVTNGDREAEILVSRFPSDHRVFRNIVKQARQALREAP